MVVVEKDWTADCFFFLAGAVTEDKESITPSSIYRWQAPRSELFANYHWFRHSLRKGRDTLSNQYWHTHTYIHTLSQTCIQSSGHQFWMATHKKKKVFILCYIQDIVDKVRLFYPETLGQIEVHIYCIKVQYIYSNLLTICKSNPWFCILTLEQFKKNDCERQEKTLMFLNDMWFEPAGNRMCFRSPLVYLEYLSLFSQSLVFRHWTRDP